MHEPDLTAQERAAKVAWQLALGCRLTTREVAELTGLSRQGAWVLVTNLSRIIPIVCDGSGEWCKVIEDEA